MHTDRAELQEMIKQAIFDDQCQRIAKLSYDNTMEKLAAGYGTEGAGMGEEIPQDVSSGTLKLAAFEAVEDGNLEAAEELAEAALIAEAEGI